MLWNIHLFIHSFILITYSFCVRCRLAETMGTIYVEICSGVRSTYTSNCARIIEIQNCVAICLSCAECPKICDERHNVGRPVPNALDPSNVTLLIYLVDDAAAAAAAVSYSFLSVNVFICTIDAHLDCFRNVPMPIRPNIVCHSRIEIGKMLWLYWTHRVQPNLPFVDGRTDEVREISAWTHKIVVNRIANVTPKTDRTCY